MLAAAAVAAVHLSAAGGFAYAIWAKMYGLEVPRDLVGGAAADDQPLLLGDGSFGGPWKYLTFWNLWIQLALCSVCLANDVLGRGAERGGSPHFIFDVPPDLTRPNQQQSRDCAAWRTSCTRAWPSRSASSWRGPSGPCTSPTAA